MKEPLGEHGGEVLRKLKLFGTDRQRGEVLTIEELGKLPMRHKVALKNAGLVRYYERPSSDVESDSSQVSTASKSKTTKKRSTKKKTAKRRTAKSKN